MAIAAEIVSGKGGPVCAVRAASCKGCAQAACGSRLKTFSVDPDTNLGPIWVELESSKLIKIWWHSLGLPLLGLMSFVGLASVADLHEGWQALAGVLGFGLLMMACRVFPDSVIRFKGR